MPYVSGGEMLESRSPWRLSFIPELFWGMVNFVVLFFQTMINPGASSRGDRYTTDYRPHSGNDPFGPGGGPRRRMGGVRRGGGPAPPPMAGGG